MSDDLSDAQIAFLCDIEEQHLSRLTDDNKRDLEHLLSPGKADQVQSSSSRARVPRFSQNEALD
jgi:hypothetical protein